jgi:hypothetical protein
VEVGKCETVRVTEEGIAGNEGKDSASFRYLGARSRTN